MEHKTENHSYLSFAINGKLYAVHVQAIIEVLDKQPITEVPKAPKHIKGVISFRGEIIPVIDARLVMDLPAEDLNDFVIIVLTVKNERYDEYLTVGTIADNVSNVIEIKPLDIVPATKFNSQIDPKYTLGVSTIDSSFVTILDTDHIFALSTNKNPDNN